MPDKMLAYRLLDWGQKPQLVEVQRPRPGRGELVVKVAGNGLCHSDLGMMHMSKDVGEMMGWQMPFTLGHEVGGWVEEIGEGVAGLKIGQPVLLISPQSDGTCPHCLRGHDNACDAGAAGRGFGRDGGLAQYVLVNNQRFVIPLNRLDPVSAGPLSDAGATAYHAVKRVLPRLYPGSTAVVIGAGGLGSFAVQFLKALSPARIIVVDNNPGRQAFARELGADEALTGVSDSTRADILSLTGGQGAAAVLDFVGIDATIGAGITSVRKTGAFGLVGAGGGSLAMPWFFSLPKDADVFCFQGSNIADATEVIALAEAGLIRNEVELFPLDQVEEAYDKLHHGQLRGRAVITPGPL